MGFLGQDITEAGPEVSVNSYTFVYDMSPEGDVTDAEESIDGAGDAASPMDGWYVANAWYSWGWGK